MIKTCGECSWFKPEGPEVDGRIPGVCKGSIVDDVVMAHETHSKIRACNIGKAYVKLMRLGEETSLIEKEIKDQKRCPSCMHLYTTPMANRYDNTGKNCRNCLSKDNTGRTTYIYCEQCKEHVSEDSMVTDDTCADCICGPCKKCGMAECFGECEDNVKAKECE